MRVALVCPYAWDRFGGVQSHIRALDRSLRARGHSTTVLAPRSSRSDAASERLLNGATIVGRSVPVPANGSVASLAFGPGSGAATRHALRDFGADVIHLHEPLIPSVSLLALLNAAAPCVGTFHAAAPRSVGYGVSRALLDRAVRRLTCRTAVSEAARDLVSHYFPGDYVLTPNGVQVERFARAEPFDLGPGLKALFVGRLEPRKGLDVLIHAMRRLRDLDARLVVAGEGPEAIAAKALALSLRVQVHWLGRLGEEELPRVYRAADVYCAPGLGGESFGIVLLEAMAAGTPVVCSDLPAFRSVAGDAASFSTPGSARSLAGALRAVLTDSALRREMGEASRRTAQRFDWARLVVGVERVYRHALAAPPPLRASAPSGSWTGRHR
jgi:phosphatidylinositol alpha-mannosyltransferase